MTFFIRPKDYTVDKAGLNIKEDKKSGPRREKSTTKEEKLSIEESDPQGSSEISMEPNTRLIKFCRDICFKVW